MDHANLTQLRREISAKYNLDMDHELVPLMAELIESRKHMQHNMQHQVEKMEQMEKTIEATAEILLQKNQSNFNQYRFESDWQAFWHGFGKLGLPLILAISFSFWGYLLWFNRGQNEQMAKDIQIFLKNHDQIASFQDLSDYQVVQNLKIGDQTLEYIQMPVVSTFKQALPGRNVVAEFQKDKKGKPTKVVIKIPLRMLNK